MLRMSRRLRPLKIDEQQLLAGFAVDAASAHPVEVQQAVHLARLLGKRAAELQTPPSGGSRPSSIG